MEADDSAWEQTHPVQRPNWKVCRLRWQITSLTSDRYWEFNHLLFQLRGHNLYMINRNSVENGDLSTVMHFVQRLTSSKDFALDRQGKIQFGFAGYDDDPRELFEIDEVRWYVAVLDHNFNGAVLLCTPLMSLRIALRLFMISHLQALAGRTMQRVAGGVPRNIIIDQADVDAVSGAAFHVFKSHLW